MDLASSNHAEGGGQFYDNGPIWRVELASPAWDRLNKAGQKTSLKKPALGER